MVRSFRSCGWIFGPPSPVMRQKLKNQVTITRGILGSYSLKINDLVHTYRVKRIK